jgi:hypothetical protein
MKYRLIMEFKMLPKKKKKKERNLRSMIYECSPENENDGGK